LIIKFQYYDTLKPFLILIYHIIWSLHKIWSLYKIIYAAHQVSNKCAVQINTSNSVLLNDIK